MERGGGGMSFSGFGQREAVSVLVAQPLYCFVNGNPKLSLSRHFG